MPVLCALTLMLAVFDLLLAPFAFFTITRLPSSLMLLALSLGLFRLLLAQLARPALVLAVLVLPLVFFLAGAHGGLLSFFLVFCVFFARAHRVAPVPRAVHRGLQ